MSPVSYQTASVACPDCQHRFVTPILTIVDPVQSSEAKALFLSGQLNIAVCPQCGHAGMLSTPLVYHDAGKELLFTFVPPEARLSEPEQQRLIGDMVNRLIAELPVEQRKGYLFRSRSFFTLDSMIQAVLEADGITPEMLAEQQARAMLLDRLLRASSEEARRLIATESDAGIDYEFFQLLTMNLDLAQAAGQRPAVEQLLRLRDDLLRWTTEGREVAAREDAIRSLGDGVTREELLDKLVQAAEAGEQIKVETMVAVARGAIDYVLFQQLTERIEAAQRQRDTRRAEMLRQLRTTILDVTAEIDAEMQQATDEAAALLRRLLDSDDPESYIRANPSDIDDVFMSVLLASLQSAQQSAQTDLLARLQRVSDAIMLLVQESQPPEVRFINELLAADSPEATGRMLQENREHVDARLLELMSLIGEDLHDRLELAERLALIREQAAAMIG